MPSDDTVTIVPTGCCHDRGHSPDGAVFVNTALAEIDRSPKGPGR